MATRRKGHKNTADKATFSGCTVLGSKSGWIAAHSALQGSERYLVFGMTTKAQGA
jgi:6-phosphofructokinase